MILKYEVYLLRFHFSRIFRNNKNIAIISEFTVLDNKMFKLKFAYIRTLFKKFSFDTITGAVMVTVIW